MSEEQSIEFEEEWPAMEKGICRLRDGHHHFKSEEYMELYTTCYKLCTQKATDYSKELHKKYKKTLEEDLTMMVLPSLRGKHGECLLKECVKRWSDHKVLLQGLSRIFSYLDRFYLPSLKLSLKEEGMLTFRNQVFDECRSGVCKAALSLIFQERGGEKIDRALLRNVVYIYVELGMGDLEYYQEWFESPMFKDTSDYYTQLASIWAKEYSCSEYLSKATECIRKECDRVCYLHTRSEAKLIQIVEHQLLFANQTQLLEKSFSGGKSTDDLSRLYRVYSRLTEGLDNILRAFKQFVHNECLAIFEEAEAAWDCKVFFRKLIQLHEKSLGYVNDCFMENTQFHKAHRAAFLSCCMKGIRGHSFGEWLAIFLNLIHTGENLRYVEKMSEKAVKLVEYVDDQIQFAEFYRSKFARRMVADRSVGAEQEASLLKMLECHCGMFITRTQKMLKDLSVAKANQSAFTKYLADNTEVSPGIDFSVTELDHLLWLTCHPDELSLPEEMGKCVEVFNGFNETKSEKRKRIWAYSKDTCNIKGKFDAKTVELIMTTYQGCK